MNRNFTALISLIIVVILNTEGITQELPKVVQPTPEASALFKFLDYPVDFATGIPQIGVPIYNIQAGELSLPISINYHSSGRKVYDETGAVGLGWTLNAGGMISRTIYGDPDDNDYITKFPVPWKKQADINPGSLEGAKYLEGIYGSSFPIPWYDTEYDIFSFSGNSISGKFVLRDDNNIKVPVLLPKKPYKIQYHKATTQFNINYFDFISIIDDHGVSYQFGKSLKDGEEYYETTSGSIGKSSWMLTEIVSADKQDTIIFKYLPFVKTKYSISQSTTILDKYTDCINRNYLPADISNDNLGTINEVTSTIQRLVEIKWRTGKVKMNLVNNSDLIESIQIESYKGQIVKKIELSQSIQDILTDGNAPVRKLDSVSFKTSEDIPVEVYRFDYFETIYPGGVQAVDGRFRDFWGYYNASGQSNMRPYLENITVIRDIFSELISIGDPGVQRTPNLAGTKSGVLKKVTFPTTGYQEFEYEQNKYNNTTTVGGGLRLSRSITDSGDGNKIYKTFKYGLNEQGFGSIALEPGLANMFLETRHQNYVQVQEHKPEIYFRKRVYYADVLPILGEFHQRPIYYPEVTEYYGTETNNIGKTVYRYDMATPTFPNSVQNLFVNSDLKHWKQNSLVEKEDFKKTVAGYMRVKKSVNTYLETTYNDEKIWGLHVGKYLFITPQDLTNSNGVTVPSYFPENAVVPCVDSQTEIFRFSDFTISVGKKELVKTEEHLYDENGDPMLSTAVNYTFNSNHLQSTVLATGSGGDIATTEYKYPFDFIPDPVHEDMIDHNMVNIPIEINSYRNGVLLSSTKTKYRNWGNGMVKPEIISARQGSNPYEDRIRFHSYTSNGKIEAVSKDNGPALSYLWSDRLNLPVASVENASINRSSEIVPVNLSSQTVQVPGIQSEYLVFQEGIEITHEQDVLLNVNLSKNTPNSPIPDYYFNITVSLFNPSSQAEVYVGTFGLTTFSEKNINNVPSGNYVLRYRYLGDIGEDYAFRFYTTLNYSKLNVYSNVYYTSFEEDQNSTLVDSHTGRKSKSGVYRFFRPAQIGQFVLSYWTKQAGSDWVYNQELINVNSTNPEEVTIGTSTSLLDEVRLYPKGSRMTTYTYDPLVGQTSATDYNNNTTYYEYDDYGRLETVKDPEKNIVRHYKYHYASEGQE